jgi:hypothetical protein
MSNQEAAEKVIGGYRIPKPEECPNEVYEIMLRCWSEKPTNRPTFSDIVTSLSDLIASVPAVIIQPLDAREISFMFYRIEAYLNTMIMRI